MPPPSGYSSNRIQKACAACGECLKAEHHEWNAKRPFTCQASTADTTGGFPANCWLHQYSNSEDTLAALKAISYTSKKSVETIKDRSKVLLAYVREVHAGEPSLSCYREQLKKYSTSSDNTALAVLPY